MTEKELAKNVKLHSFGTFSTDFGWLALKRGFKVTGYTMHLSLLASLNLSFGTKITKKILDSIKVSPKDRMIFERWEKFVKEGGVLIWDRPKVNQLEQALKSRIPGIISLNTALLGRFWKKWDNGHYLVVSGVKGKNILVVDPDPPKKNKSYHLDQDTLLNSWIVNSLWSSDYLLLIEKKISNTI